MKQIRLPAVFMRGGTSNAIVFNARDLPWDRVLITFGDEMRLIISPVLKHYLPNDAIASEFVRREGQPLICPDRFFPAADFPSYHHDRIFRLE